MLPVGRKSTITPRPLATLNARYGMRPLVPGSSRQRGWTANRPPTSQRLLLMHSQSYTGSSATSIDGSDAIKGRRAGPFNCAVNSTVSVSRCKEGIGGARIIVLMDDAFSWGSLIAAFIGATAALAGVVISQLFERRKAHDDRIWVKRLDVYVEAMAWCEAWRRYALYRTNPETWAAPTPKRPSPLLDEQQYAKAQAFGSAKVIKSIQDLSRGALDFVWLEEDGATSPRVRQRADETWQDAVALRRALRDEMGVGVTESDSERR
jgi:hypothetical protein